MKINKAPCGVSRTVSISKGNITSNDGGDCVKGGILKGTKYAWLCQGSFLKVIDVSSGEKIAGWRFGSACLDFISDVSCVVELPHDDACNIKQIVLGLECEIIGGMICIFDVRGSRLLRAIRIPGKPLSLSIVDSGNSGCEGRYPLPGLLSSMCGIIAVGLQGGSVFLIDLCRLTCDELLNTWFNDDREEVRDEMNPCQLIPINKDDDDSDKLEKKCAAAAVSGDHLCLLLNEGAFVQDNFLLLEPGGEVCACLKIQNIGVTSLLYVPQIASLIVGFSFGCFQLWNLMHLTLNYTSRAMKDPLPVMHLGFQEPSDDPCNFCYLWAVHSSTDEFPSSSVPVGIMYALSYDSKEWVDGYGYLYQDYQSCHFRFEYNLEVDTSEDVDSICCVSFNTLGNVATQRNMPEDGYDEVVTDNDLSLCAFAWEAYDSENKPISTYLSLFDLNQWYKAQMPVRIADTEEENLGYLVTFSLNCARQKGEEASLVDIPLLDIKVDPQNISQFKSFQPQEEHFHPSALSLVSHCLLEDKIVSVSHPGLQRYLLLYMEKEGPICLLRPVNLFKHCVMVGLKPILVDVNVSTEVSMVTQREYLLSVALENQMLGFLHRCASDWANGSVSGVECSLPMLLSWGYQRANVLYKTADELCVHLFDHSGVRLDKNECRLLDNCATQLRQLATLFQGILNDCRLLSLLNLEDFKQKTSELNLASLYFEVLQWFLNVGLLPEFPENNSDLEASDVCNTPVDKIPYPATTLTKLYTDRRLEFKILNSKNGTKACLYIDQLLQNQDNSSKLASLWQSDGGTGNYPPPSIQSLLAMYLLDGIDIQTKHSIVIYVFLDLATLLDPERYGQTIEYFVKFPCAFCMTPSIIKITQAFWLLDQKHFEDALDMMLDPLLSLKDLQPWQHQFIVNALLSQGQHSKALEYFTVRQYPIQGIEDIQLKISLLVMNKQVTQAYNFLHEYHNEENGKELLCHFYKECGKVQQLGMVLKLMLSPAEEELLMNFLQNSNISQSEDMQVVYYLMRSRIIEAVAVNERINFSGNRKSRIRRSRNDPNVRDLLVQGYSKTLPSVTRQLANYCSQQQKLLSNWRQVQRPTPMSVDVNYGTKQPVSYKSSLIQATLEKARETWMMPIHSSFSSQARNKEMLEVSAMQNLPFLCTSHDNFRHDRETTPVVFPSVTGSIKRRFDDDVCSLSSTPLKKSRLENSSSVESFLHPTIKKNVHGDSANNSSLLLKSPLVKRVTPFKQQNDHSVHLKNATKPFAENFTPQSILKVRNFIRRSKSPEQSEEHDLLSKEHTGAQQSEEKSCARQIRFSFPVSIDMEEHRPLSSSTPERLVDKTISPSRTIGVSARLPLRSSLSLLNKPVGEINKENSRNISDKKSDFSSRSMNGKINDESVFDLNYDSSHRRDANTVHTGDEENVLNDSLRGEVFYSATNSSNSGPSKDDSRIDTNVDEDSLLCDGEKYIHNIKEIKPRRQLSRLKSGSFNDNVVYEETEVSMEISYEKKYMCSRQVAYEKPETLDIKGLQNFDEENKVNEESSNPEQEETENDDNCDVSSFERSQQIKARRPLSQMRKSGNFNHTLDGSLSEVDKSRNLTTENLRRKSILLDDTNDYIEEVLYEETKGNRDGKGNDRRNKFKDKQNNDSHGGNFSLQKMTEDYVKIRNNTIETLDESKEVYDDANVSLNVSSMKSFLGDTSIEGSCDTFDETTHKHDEFSEKSDGSFEHDIQTSMSEASHNIADSSFERSQQIKGRRPLSRIRKSGNFNCTLDGSLSEMEKSRNLETENLQRKSILLDDTNDYIEEVLYEKTKGNRDDKGNDKWNKLKDKQNNDSCGGDFSLQKMTEDYVKIRNNTVETLDESKEVYDDANVSLNVFTMKSFLGDTSIETSCDTYDETTHKHDEFSEKSDGSFEHDIQTLKSEASHNIADSSFERSQQIKARRPLSRIRKSGNFNCTLDGSLSEMEKSRNLETENLQRKSILLDDNTDYIEEILCEETKEKRDCDNINKSHNDEYDHCSQSSKSQESRNKTFEKNNYEYVMDGEKTYTSLTAVTSQQSDYKCSLHAQNEANQAITVQSYDNDLENQNNTLTSNLVGEKEHPYELTSTCSEISVCESSDVYVGSEGICGGKGVVSGSMKRCYKMIPEFDRNRTVECGESSVDQISSSTEGENSGTIELDSDESEGKNAPETSLNEERSSRMKDDGFTVENSEIVLIDSDTECNESISNEQNHECVEHKISVYKESLGEEQQQILEMKENSEDDASSPNERGTLILKISDSESDVESSKYMEIKDQTKMVEKTGDTVICCTRVDTISEEKPEIHKETQHDIVETSHKYEIQTMDVDQCSANKKSEHSEKIFGTLTKIPFKEPSFSNEIEVPANFDVLLGTCRTADVAVNEYQCEGSSESLLNYSSQMDRPVKLSSSQTETKSGICKENVFESEGSKISEEEISIARSRQRRRPSSIQSEPSQMSDVLITEDLSLDKNRTSQGHSQVRKLRRRRSSLQIEPVLMNDEHKFKEEKEMISKEISTPTPRKKGQLSSRQRDSDTTDILMKEFETKTERTNIYLANSSEAVQTRRRRSSLNVEPLAMDSDEILTRKMTGIVTLTDNQASSQSDTSIFQNKKEVGISTPRTKRRSSSVQSEPPQMSNVLSEQNDECILGSKNKVDGPICTPRTRQRSRPSSVQSEPPLMPDVFSENKTPEQNDECILGSKNKMDGPICTPRTRQRSRPSSVQSEPPLMSDVFPENKTPEQNNECILGSKNEMDGPICTPRTRQRSRPSSVQSEPPLMSDVFSENKTPEQNDECILGSKNKMDSPICTPRTRQRSRPSSVQSEPPLMSDVFPENKTPEQNDESILGSKSKMDGSICTPRTRQRSRPSSVQSEPPQMSDVIMENQVANQNVGIFQGRSTDEGRMRRRRSMLQIQPTQMDDNSTPENKNEISKKISMHETRHKDFFSPVPKDPSVVSDISTIENEPTDNVSEHLKEERRQRRSSLRSKCVHDTDTELESGKQRIGIKEGSPNTTQESRSHSVHKEPMSIAGSSKKSENADDASDKNSKLSSSFKKKPQPSSSFGNSEEGHKMNLRSQRAYSEDRDLPITRGRKIISLETFSESDDCSIQSEPPQLKDISLGTGRLRPRKRLVKKKKSKNTLYKLKISPPKLACVKEEPETEINVGDADQNEPQNKLENEMSPVIGPARNLRYRKRTDSISSQTSFVGEGQILGNTCRGGSPSSISSKSTLILDHSNKRKRCSSPSSADEQEVKKYLKDKDRKSTDKSEADKPKGKSTKSTISDDAIEQYATARRLTRYQKNVLERSIEVTKSVLHDYRERHRHTESHAEDSDGESEASSFTSGSSHVRTSARLQEKRLMMVDRSPSQSSSVSVGGNQTPKKQIMRYRTSVQSPGECSESSPASVHSGKSTSNASSVSNSKYQWRSPNSQSPQKPRRKSFQKAQNSLFTSTSNKQTSPKASDVPSGDTSEGEYEKVPGRKNLKAEYETASEAGSEWSQSSAVSSTLSRNTRSSAKNSEIPSPIKSQTKSDQSDTLPKRDLRHRKESNKSSLPLQNSPQRDSEPKKEAATSKESDGIPFRESQGAMWDSGSHRHPLFRKRKYFKMHTKRKTT